MNRVAPASPIVDLSHGVPPLDVRGGAVLLVDSLPYLGLGRAERVATYSDVESGDWGVIVDPRGWLLVIRGNPATHLRASAVSRPATRSG